MKPYIAYKTPRGLLAGTTLRGRAFYPYHTTETAEDRYRVSESRSALLSRTDFSRLITLRQTHSDKIHKIDLENLDHYSNHPDTEGDALMTDLPAVLIGVLTADCVPILFGDAEGKWCGAVHGGWKGLKKKIHLKFLKALKKEYGAQTENMTVIVGPHIRNCCYEVGEEFENNFPPEAFNQKRGRLYFDMEKLIIHDLVEAGIPESSIRTSPLCTSCSEKPAMYSYRKGEVKNRHLSFIGIKR